MNRARLVSFDRLDYEHAWQLQQRLVAQRQADAIPDTVMLLEHPGVFTIGRTGQAAHWGGDETCLRDTGVPVLHVERGGSITYHGPGQLVGYPILRLADYCPGPKAYMAMLEETLIRTLADSNVVAERRPGLIGVWVGDRKIAAMGVRIIRGVTMHGFALNVDIDLTPFSRIVPCGIAGCRVTSMAALLDQPVDRDAVRGSLTKRFAEVFQLEWTAPLGEMHGMAGLTTGRPA